ncbi:MAG: hypothetical protein LUE64_02895 [Candidatus Gastranaerophilales bacterium]|nr:hypothetical protein [Candidatus Gastranaerophilales bacterium]
MKLKIAFLACLFAASIFSPSLAIQDTNSSYGGSGEDIYIDNDTYKLYKKITKDERLIQAVETMKGGLSDYSRNAILGDNLTGKPVKLEFRDLSQLNPAYASFDALGWKQKEQLYIFINIKHQDAPKEALASVLSHEAIHQDELNSLNEETYCWTLEAAVWTNFTEKNPNLENINHPLVDRENTIKRLFIKGNYSDKYIRKSVLSNAGYQSLPSRSPGFEDEDL